MGKIFFIADIHHLHNRILEYDKRPFDSINHMHSIIALNWNHIVKPDDEVYILGDVSFNKKQETIDFLNSLNGKKYLIRGNHDHKMLSNPEIVNCFEWIKDYYELKWFDSRDKKEYFIVLFHYPIGAWNKSHRASIHLHGHSHMSYADKGRMMDVCVANPLMNWAPISLERVVDLMRDVPIYFADKHNGEETE